MVDAQGNGIYTYDFDTVGLIDGVYNIIVNVTDKVGNSKIFYREIEVDKAGGNISNGVSIIFELELS